MSQDQEKCVKCNHSDSHQKCSKCKIAPYCSKECQTSHWPIHKPICRPYSPKEVWGVVILSADQAKNLNIPGEQWEKRCRHELVTTDHPIFTLGELCPVPALCGIPLLIYSHFMAGPNKLSGEKSSGNQPAVYLRIEPDSGIAPMMWLNNNPGPCIIVRRDRKPLTLQAIETILEFHKTIINGFGYPESDGWAPAREYMTKAAFQFFSRDYYQQQDKKGRPGFDAFYKPL